jgi:hypothetical protein
VAARISIEDGAFFKGGIDIRKAGQKVNGEEVKEVKATASTPEPATTAVARA